MAKQKEKAAMAEFEVLQMLKEGMKERELPARALDFTDEQQKIVKQLLLLKAKPMLYVANVGEDDIIERENNPQVQQIKAKAEKERAEWTVLYEELKREIAR